MRSMIQTLMCGILGLLIGADVRAEETLFVAAPDGLWTVSHCGVYAAYGAMKSIGVPVELYQLEKPKYVTEMGSTAENLVRLLADNGVAASPMQGLSLLELTNSPGPTILNVAGNPVDREFNHWILCLGPGETGGLRIIDWGAGRDSIDTVWEESKLLARWNGIGIVVTPKPVSWWDVNLVRIVLGAAIGCIALIGLRSVCLSRTGKRAEALGTLSKIGIILGLSCTVSIGLHAFCASGFLRNGKYVHQVATRFRPDELRHVAMQETLTNAASGKWQLVDARLADDFASGSIPHAMSFPINVRNVEKRIAELNLDKYRPTILFCMNEKCRWSHALGRRLEAEGFADVRVYPGGWDEWEESTRKSEKQNAEPEGK